MNTYIIEGGIGKQVAFTAIIDALKARVTTLENA